MADKLTEKKYTLPDESEVRVWCEGRVYESDDEAYRPRYCYRITTPDWEYERCDIQGATNEVPELDGAGRSLFAFLYAAQESWSYQPKGENADMFPDYVNEWAYDNSTTIALLSVNPEEHPN
jgi:hypothetical protein